MKQRGFCAVVLGLMVLAFSSGVMGGTTVTFSLSQVGQPNPETMLADLVERFLSMTGYPIELREISCPTQVADLLTLAPTVNSIIDSTWIPVVENGELIDLIPIAEVAEAAEENPMLQEKLNDLSTAMLDLVGLGDVICDLNWRWQSRDLTTKAVVAGNTLKFESIMGFSAVEFVKSPKKEIVEGSLQNSLINEDSIYNGFRMRTIAATEKVIVRSEDKRTITDHTELISFQTLFLWEAKATKEVSEIVLGEVECTKAIITIIWASGFKRVRGKVSADGFAVEVEVEGRLGSHGQIQRELVACANGRAQVDGEDT